MALAFKEMGTLLVADAADPNTTPPAESRIFDVKRYASHGEYADGIGFYLEFTGGAGPTADVEVWIRDKFAGTWSLVTTFAALAGRVYKSVRAIRTAEVFLRVAVIAGAPTNVKPRVATI